MTTTSDRDRPRTALVVDDMPDNRTLLDRVLRTAGFTVVQAENGSDAIAAIVADVPDIVLLDWMMPGLSGLDTLRAIRERHSRDHLPVIMCTALDEESSVVSALDAGANDYMTKPISLPILRARIRTHLDQRDAVRTLTDERQSAERRLGEQTRALFAQFDDAPDALR